MYLIRTKDYRFSLPDHFFHAFYRYSYFVIFASLFFLFSYPVSAEIVYLRNGRAQAGSIFSQSPDYISMRDNGKLIRLKKKEILRIDFQSSRTEEERLRNKSDIEEMLDWQEELDRHLARRRKIQDEKESEQVKRSEEEKNFFRDEIFELKERKKKAALYRSLVFPGWGQIYKEQNLKAYTWMGLAVFSVGVSYYSFQEYAALSDSYNQNNLEYIGLYYSRHDMLLSWNAYSNSRKIRDNMQTNTNRGYHLIGLFAIVYLLNVVDAYYTDMDLGITDESAHSDIRTRIDFSMVPDIASSYDFSKNKYREDYTYYLRYSLFF